MWKTIGKTSDKLNVSYNGILFIGGFKVEPEEAKMGEFLNMCSLKNLVIYKTFFGNPEKPSCVDLVIKRCHFFGGYADYTSLIF